MDQEHTIQWAPSAQQDKKHLKLSILLNYLFWATDGPLACNYSYQLTSKSKCDNLSTRT